MKNNFNDWFFNKVGSSKPYPESINEFDFIDVVINVSDEFNFEHYNYCIENKKHYHWFPITEINDMGINSIFAALQILFITEKQNKIVLLHCHAGVNRSRTIFESYYFLRTGKYLFEEKNDDIILNMFKFKNEKELFEYQNLLKKNRIENNIYLGNLPSEYKYIRFLKECNKIFNGENNINLESLKLKLKIC